MTKHEQSAVPLLKSMPCEECTRPPDDCWCREYTAACEIAEHARQSADGIASLKHIDDKSRAELASQTADAIDNALYDVGARLDDRAFLMACGAVCAAKAVVP